MTKTVKVSELVEDLGLEVLQGNKESLKRDITTSDISRPGLELAGFLDYFSRERIQMFGLKEITYLKEMPKKQRLERMRSICTDDTPTLIITRNLEPDESILLAAAEKDIPILHSPVPTTRLIAGITSYLDDCLAERTSIHGVFMDIYGLGVLIQGDSGIGKSETALELINRGHRLIADDRVDVYQKDELTVIGEAPKILEHLLEIRGVGIIDVMNLFGASGVKSSGQVRLAIYLEIWSKDKKFDRLGNDSGTITLANVDIPQVRVPVRTGRNLSIIIEAAAMNFRARNMGYDAVKTFEERLTNLIEENSEA